MGKNNPRKQSSPEAKKQAAIWCAIAVIAVAVMMLMANPWKHQSATTAPQANSAAQTQSDAKHEAKAKKREKQRPRPTVWNRKPRPCSPVTRNRSRTTCATY